MSHLPMPSPNREAVVQIGRVSDYFNGPMGRANYDRLVQNIAIKSNRYKMLAGWAAHSGEDFLHKAVSLCLEVGANGACIRKIPETVPVGLALEHIAESLMNHAYQSKGRRLAGEIPVTQSDSDKEAPVFEPSEMFWMQSDDRLTPEQREAALARVDAFIAFVKPDAVVHGMLHLIRSEGLNKPVSMIAQRLGVSETEIYLARKRLASAAGRYIKQMKMD